MNITNEKREPEDEYSFVFFDSYTYMLVWIYHLKSLLITTKREREEKYGIEDLWSQEEVALDPVEVREYEGNHRYFPHLYVFSSFLFSPFL